MPKSGDPMPALDELFTIIYKNRLSSTKFKYKIFDGYYKEEAKFYHAKEIIERHFKEYIPFSKEEMPSTALLKHPNLAANEFYFNASTGKFVTSEVLPLLLEDSTITEEENKPRHR